MNTNNSKPLVSVIILSYNNEKYIKSSIESVVNQTYDNLEIIVTDDCSNDSSFEIISNYRTDDRFIINQNSKNLGITKNFNVGLSLSNGKYVVFTGGDDLFERDKIKIQVEFMLNNKNLKISYHNAYLIDENGEYLNKDFNHTFNPFRKGGLLTSLYHGTFNCGCTTMIISTELKFNEKIKSTSDWLFYLELLSSGGEIDFIDKNLASYRRHIGSYTFRSGYISVIRHTILTYVIFFLKYPKYTFHILFGLLYRLIRSTYYYFGKFLKNIFFNNTNN